MQNHSGARPQIWAGPECTINRVGDQYFDQLARTGHDNRPEDLELLAGLGIKAVRYPVLWERHATDPIDWTWADERLHRLRELGITPIVGLIHHGSGPPHTSLVDPSYAKGLATFAAQVADRFPWIEAYTPVNEPLTTARFSGLYGHWYPHGRDAATFAQCFLTQCRAVVLAMQAVRKVNPEAILVQTEDLGRTHAPKILRYQADFENERRWLTWDLLCGRLDRGHPLWGYLRWTGVPEAEIAWFGEHPCPPDIVGVNHYVTSDRYLDDQIDRYPADKHGTNGQHRYVDIEAVRVLPGGVDGLYRLLRQVWQRYALPLAITEAHIGCTADEQMRWIWEAWRAASRLHDEGADIRAVTPWSLFGAYDWDSLVTQSAGHYESGAFDIRDGSPQPTPVAEFLRDLAAGREPRSPMLATLGWWRRPERLLDVVRGRRAVATV
jgi:dTDP-4-dehydrorhamnose reductase